MLLSDCSDAHQALHSFPTRRSSDLLQLFLGPEEPPRPNQEHDEQAEERRDVREQRIAPAHGGHLDGGDEERGGHDAARSEEHTSELHSPYDIVCRLLLEKKKKGKAR